MRAVADTSVILGSILDGREREHCASALETSGASAAGHAWFESFSVLTRLPPDVRLAPSDAHRALVAATVGGPRFLSGKEQEDFQSWLRSSSVAGGAIYDALVGWVAKCAGVPLVTRDVRALPTYRALEIELLVIDPLLS